MQELNASPRLSLRPTRINLAPCFANAMAVARPIPEVAPVMTHVRSRTGAVSFAFGPIISVAFPSEILTKIQLPQRSPFCAGFPTAENRFNQTGRNKAIRTTSRRSRPITTS